MKTYEKMAQNVIKRVSNYKTKKKKIRNIVIPVLSFCIVSVIGLGIWQSGLAVNNSNVTDYDEIASSENLKKPQTNQSTDDIDCSDEVAVIYKDGRLFVQTDADISKYSKGEYLGNASDFDGFYKKHSEVDGDLFQSAEDENILLAFLNNNSVVILKFSDKVFE